MVVDMIFSLVTMMVRKEGPSDLVIDGFFFHDNLILFIFMF
jgi:hypothetical protein